MKKQPKFKVFSGQRHDKPTTPAKRDINEIKTQLRDNQNKINNLQKLISKHGK